MYFWLHGMGERQKFPVYETLSTLLTSISQNHISLCSIFIKPVNNCFHIIAFSIFFLFHTEINCPCTLCFITGRQFDNLFPSWNWTRQSWSGAVNIELSKRLQNIAWRLIFSWNISEFAARHLLLCDCWSGWLGQA